LYADEVNDDEACLYEDLKVLKLISLTGPGEKCFSLLGFTLFSAGYLQQVPCYQIYLCLQMEVLVDVGEKLLFG